MEFWSPAATKVAKIATFVATNDEYFVKMIFSYQCMDWRQLLGVIYTQILDLQAL